MIAGGGPTGLMLAGELALAGVDVGIVERRPTQELDGSRAGGLQPRTIEVLDQRGIADRFLAEGQVAPVVTFASVRLDTSDLPTRHPYILGLWQNHIERILAEWVGELGVPILRDREITGFAQDDTRVGIEIADGTSMRAEYLVGCDGGRSVVRKAAGIEFRGSDPTVSNLTADVVMDEPPPMGVHRGPIGTYAFGSVEYSIRDGQVVYADDAPVRVMVPEAHPGSVSEPTFADVRAALIGVCGTDYGLREATNISRFTDASRQAVTYRDRRVLLAGDAAHVHYPLGGQGLNTGVQDAVNLGWKLGRVVARTAPESLLDSYHSERHPVGARVLRNTMAQVALQRTGDRTDALREVVAELLALDEPRRRFAAMMAGLDIGYDLGEGHPLLGCRVPDLDLVIAEQPRRLFTLLHAARPVFLNFGSSRVFDVDGWTDRVEIVDARYDGAWELPGLDPVPAPKAVLVRPDGHVAWVATDERANGLSEALNQWFGPAQS